MANWANPTITSQYDVFVNEAKDRDVDSATMFLNAPSGPPTGAIQFARLSPTTYTLREFSGSAFADRSLSVAGGGTGAADAVTARNNLGIGSMGSQNSNAVNIIGGTIQNITYLSLSCSIVFTAGAVGDPAVHSERR